MNTYSDMVRQWLSEHTQTEWVVAPAAVEIIAKESETAQIEAELRAKIQQMRDMILESEAALRKAEPSPLVAAVAAIHRAGKRLPNRWPEF